MKYQVIIRPEVEIELKEVFTWYEDKREGLGYDFLLQVDAGLRFVERDPKICKTEYRGTRKYIVRKFPYKLIYLLEEEKIIVLAVIHCRRSQNLVKRRINNNI